MEIKKYTVFIIDDHPLITEAYKSALDFYSSENEGVQFVVKTAQNCDSGLKLFSYFTSKKKSVDIIFLDIKLPPSKDGEILSGEDLGIKIKKLQPKAKIIVSTTFNDNYRIHSIFKSLNPDGFLIKNDIAPNELIETIDTIINDPPYYSKTVVKLLRKEVSNSFTLDNIDRKLLYELSIGTKTKDLPSLIPLSIAGIEKRKRQIKQVFGIEKQDDKVLIQTAKEKGFL